MNKVLEAMADYWGERCPEFEAGCPCCEAWAELDGMTAPAPKAPAKTPKGKAPDLSSREGFTDWAYEMFDLYGVREPESYGAAEIIAACPGVPEAFTRAHVARRDARLRGKP